MSMPTLFVSHGSPMLYLEQDVPGRTFLANLGGLVPKPQAIVAVSAHWCTEQPAVSLTALGEDSWYAQVTLLGHVVSIEDDPELAGIDRLSIRYYGKPFHNRDARRVSAWMEPERWSSWPLPR